MLGRDQAWNTAFANDEIMEAVARKLRPRILKIRRRRRSAPYLRLMLEADHNRALSFAGSSLSSVRSSRLAEQGCRLFDLQRA